MFSRLPWLSVLTQGSLVFKVEAYDGVDVTSRGTHERFVINKAKFSAKVK